MSRRYLQFDFTAPELYKNKHTIEHVRCSIANVSIRQELYSKIKDQMEGEFIRDKEQAYNNYWGARLRKQEGAQMMQDLEAENVKVLKAEREELKEKLTADVEEDMRPYLLAKTREEGALKEEAFEIVR